MGKKKLTFFQGCVLFLKSVWQFLCKFYNGFKYELKQKDKHKHFIVSMFIMYYLGTLHYITGKIENWVLWALFIGFAKEFFWDWFLGSILKMRKISKIFGIADWWDFLFDWLGIMIGLILLWIGKNIIGG